VAVTLAYGRVATATAPGAFSETGADVTLTKSSNSYELSAGSGVFLDPGHDAGLGHHYVLGAESGAFGVEGRPATLTRSRPAPKKVLVFDRGGGGAIGNVGPTHDVSDYVAVLGSFRELVGEHPVERAARRTRHIAENLPRITRERQADERVGAAGVLWGATLERLRAAGDFEQIKAELAAATVAGLEGAKADLAEIMLAEIGKAEAARRALVTQRGERGAAWIAPVLIGLGVVGIVVLAKRSKATKATKTTSTTKARAPRSLKAKANAARKRGSRLG
jgi:hypothetical protein